MTDDEARTLLQRVSLRFDKECASLSTDEKRGAMLVYALLDNLANAISLGLRIALATAIREAAKPDVSTALEMLNKLSAMECWEYAVSELDDEAAELLNRMLRELFLPGK